MASSPVTSASTQRRCLGREFGCHAFPSMVLAHLRRSQEALSDQVSRWEQAFSSACDAAIHGKEGDFMYCHSTESILLLHREETEELTLKIGPTKKALRHQLAEMGIAFRIWHPSGRSAEEEAEPMRPAVVAPEIADDLRALVAVPGQLVSLYSSKRLSQSISSKRAKPSTTIVLAGLASIAPFLAHHLQGQLSLIAAQMAVMLDPHHRQPVSPDWLPRIFSPSPFVHGVWVGLSFQASEFWRPGLMAQSTERGHLLSVQPGIPGMPLLPNQIRALVASLKTENPHLLIESKIVPWKESIFGHLLSVDPFPCFVIYRDQILIE
ncbi:MAG: hypothetical protein Q8P67_18830 [archaeon]|nr:hypothetical protein [archaeon]